MRVNLNVVKGKGLPRIIETEASSLDQARQQATSRGLVVLSAQPAGLFRVGSANNGAATSRLDVAVFVEQLRDLLVAGLSVTEALDALRRGVTPSAGSAIERVARQLNEGKTLSDAFAANGAFPALLVALVRAAELTSDLPQALNRFLEHDERTAEVRHRIVSTSIYPMLLIGVGGLVLLFLLFYVMPRFARVFEGMTGHLPWSARAMVAWAQFMRDHGALATVSIVLVLLGFGSLLTPAVIRAAVLSRVLAWAPLRQRLNIYFLARWYRATGMLVQGGIPLPQALALSNGLLPMAMRSNGDRVAQGVQDGLAPSAAFARAGMTTPVAEQLMLAGERTGDLGAVLTRIAHFHESEVTRHLESTMRAVEPVVMVLIGLGVGLVVVLMYLPIFELAAAIQ